MQCSLFYDGKNELFSISGEKDGLIDETELAMDYKFKLAMYPKNKGKIPDGATDEIILGLVRWQFNIYDEDGDKKLDMTECANMHKPPVNISESNRNTCQDEDGNNDGILTADEIIAFHEKVGTSTWACCEADINCIEAPEDCQKEAMKNWIENYYFALANNRTAKKSVTIDECVMIEDISFKERMTTCNSCNWIL